MKKIMNYLSLCIIVIASICIVSCKNTSKEVPTYEGMTLSKSARNMSFSSTNNKESKPLLEQASESFEEISEAELKEEVDEIVSLEVMGDSTTKYFVTPGETVIVEIHLSNPSSFEIQSLTLNGKKHTNYMFKDGSTLELLLIETNAPSESGYHDLTIDAIKYIDDTEIKDVRMNGDKSIKMGVKYDRLPSVTNVKDTIDTMKINLSFNVNDPKNMIGDNPLEIYLTDGEKVVSKQSLNLGENKITFDNLIMGKTYQYGIVAVYDEMDGKNLQEHWLEKNTFTTKQAFNFTNAIATQTKITFEYNTLSNEASIDSIELIDAVSNKVIASTKTNEFSNVLSNHEYYIKLSFHYVINGNEINDSSIIRIKTQAKIEPTVELIDVTSTQTSIAYDIKTEDIDSILSIEKIELYNGNEAVTTHTTLDEKTFLNLLSNTEYKIVVIYQYDLNDGVGLQTKNVQVKYPTLASEVEVEELVLLNSGVVKLGEEINLRVYFNNPLEKELKSIYVNGIKAEVVGGDRIESAIIKVIPEEDGLIDFYIDRVDYETFNQVVNQKVKSEVYVTYPIYGTLEVEFEPLTYSPYEYTGEGTLVKFNNDKDYKVYKINDSTNFIKISKGIYFVSNANNYFWNDSISMTSIEFGYNHFGSTTQTLNYSYQCHKTNLLKYVYTVEDFISMTDGYYILMNDLDFRKTTLSSSINLSGILDGQGHTLRGLSNVIDTNSTGVYSMFSGNGSIYDVEIKEIYASINSGNYLNFSFGNVNFINCEISGDVIVSSNVNIQLNFDASNKINLNVTEDKIVKQLQQTAVKRTKNSNVFNEDNLIYYMPKTGEKLLLKVYDCFEELDLSTEYAYIDDAIFVGLTKLKKLIMPNYMTTLPSCIKEFYKLKIEELVLPESLTSIEGSGYYECDSLTSLTIGNSLTSIRDSAFYYRNLTNVYYEGTIEDWCKISFGSEISNPMYFASHFYIRNSNHEWEEVTSIEIPNAITEIGQYQFYGFDNVTSITIPNSVTSIEKYAFGGCSSLTNVYYEGTIEDWCKISFGSEISNPMYFASHFYIRNSNHEWEEVTSIEIPNAITEIGQYQFYGFDNVTSITIPNSITSIGYSAFSDCGSLKEVYYMGTTTDWNNIKISYNSFLTSVTRYYYSEIKPTEEGNYWHYVDGVPTKWDEIN